jgi:MFS transporter, AAHS family, 4-hydroxybenzoate transporter
MAAPRTVNLSEIIERQKLTPFIVRIVVLCWIVTFFDGFDMSAMSFVAPDLSASLHLSRLMLGNVFSAGQAGMMLGGFVFGYFGDRIGRRPSIILATASFGVLTLGLAASGSYATLLVLRPIQGLAIGGLLPLAWALNIEYVPRGYRSTVVTLVMLGYTFGSSSAGPVTVWLVPRYGWRSVFVVGGCAALVATGALVLALPESIKYLVNKNASPERIAEYARRLGGDPRISASDRFILPAESAEVSGPFRVPMLFRGELRWITPLIWFTYGVSSVAVFFSSTWGPSVLQMIGFSRSASALAASVNILGGAVGGLILMRFIDKRGAISIAAFPALAVPILLAMGLAGIAGRGFLALYFFATLCMVGAHLGIQSISGIFYPSAYRANGAGWAASIGKIGSIVGPALGGIVLSSRLPVKDTFALLAICPFIVCGAALAIGQLQRKLAETSPLPTVAETVASAAAFGAPE